MQALEGKAPAVALGKAEGVQRASGAEWRVASIESGGSQRAFWRR